MPRKLTVSQVENMTDAEIESHWFKGASPSEFRSLRDYVSDDALVAMTEQKWRGRILMDSVWAAIDAMLTEEGV